jgi:hypothetical protein
MRDATRYAIHTFEAFGLIEAGVEDLSLALECYATGYAMSDAKLTAELLRPRAHPVNVAAFVIGT